MSELDTITAFASSAEKLGIIGVLFIFLAYKIYQYQTMSKQVGQVLQDLKEKKDMMFISRREQTSMDRRFR